jgi:hypothetical protein
MVDNVTDLSAILANRMTLEPAEDFHTTVEGRILPKDPHNTQLALRLLGIHFRWNDFEQTVEVHSLPANFPDGFITLRAELMDAGAERVRLHLNERWTFFPSKDLFETVVRDLAYHQRYHPVKEYLAALVWDGVPRLERAFIDHAGAEDTPFNRATSRLWFIAGVRRIRVPGAKFDTLPVYESRQGKNKSSFLRLMAVREAWFTDDLPFGEKSREVIEQTAGVWIVEFPDLTGMSKREVNQIKSFITRQTDKARKAYGRRAEKVGRQWIGAATSNDDEYLSDNENRRWWPMAVKLFDLAWFEANRDQLWAEAAHYEALGESITLPESLWEAAAEVQASREIPNPFFDRLQALYHGGPDILWDFNGWVTVEDVWNSLKIPLDKRRSQSTQLGLAMKKLGFTKVRVKARNDIHGPRDTSYYQRGAGDRNLAPPGTTAGPWHGGTTAVVTLGGSDDVDMG